MSAEFEAQINALLEKLLLPEKVALLSGLDAWNTHPIPRLDIPSLTMTDGPHGVRATQTEAGRMAGRATSFPTGVSMAASWDPELIERVAAALAEETLALGCDVLLGPCVNIVRTPLAGRNFEAYSEDPYLAGRIGVAWVKGLQGKGVGASLKHYACNNQEIERFRGNSIVDERTLREIYLPAFEAVVKETQPWTVMCAYNRINGDYASEHQHLLTEILKEEWGFAGAVISDWSANHTVTASVKGGLDLEMPGPAKYYGDLLTEAVMLWQIDEDEVDESARRILRLLAWAGKLDESAERPSGAVNTPEHQALARELAEASVTLLKNEDALLPFDETALERVAVIGPNAAEARIGGGGSSYLEPPYRVSPLEGLRTRLGDDVDVRYAQGCDNFVVLPALDGDALAPAQGAGPGLWGEYFANAELAGEPVVERVDEKLEFGWYNSSPAEEISREAFSARWTGTLTVPESGQYTFALTNTGHARVTLDGELLAESERSAGYPEAENESAVVSRDLEAERAYKITIEFVHDYPSRFIALTLALARTYREGEDDRIAQAAALAAESDVAVIFAGMPKGFESEGHDRPNMALPGPQTELIRAVVAANPNTVVVLNCGAPVALPWADEVPALLLAYYPGQEAGNALAHVLLGDVNPSGKLPVTFPRRLQDNPTYINYPGYRDVRYGEGIFVGYRYYDAKDVAPRFPFGFGLSYTTFAYDALEAPERAAIGEEVTVAVMVENTGERAGQEIVQLYVGDAAATLARPPQELKCFQKVALQPGARARVEFTLDHRAFAFYDPHQGAWVVEPGEFELLVGSSSRDIRARATLVLE